MTRWLVPQAQVSEDELRAGLRALLLDGVYSQVMGVLTGGAFLVAFALMLGASNTVIGLLAAVGPATQLLQIPAIYLVDRFRRRKMLVVLSSVVSRLAWMGIALLPWVCPVGWRVGMLLLGLGVYFGLGAVSGCAWNSWMRDFIPQEILGAYSARRLAVATAIGAGLSLVAGFGVEWLSGVAGFEQGAYAVLFAVGGVAGLIGTYFQTRIPEPAMAPVDDTGLMALLAGPFRDRNFQKLLTFMGLWSFAINLAAPFFTVYLLKRIGLSMGWVIVLSVLSQGANVLFFRVWGQLADRFTNKSVLSVSGLLFVISIAIWPFTTLPDPYTLTIPLVVAIHLLAGMSTAGVTLCTANIALKAAPYGRATAYLAVNAIVTGVASTVAPLLAGVFADVLADKQLTLTLTWSSAGSRADLPTLDLMGLDFLFVIAVAFGGYALHRLLSVREEGEVSERVVYQQLITEVRAFVRSVSNIAGFRWMVGFPYAKLTQMLRPGGRNGRVPVVPGDGEPPRDAPRG